jgi:hypothetical protein
LHCFLKPSRGQAGRLSYGFVDSVILVFFFLSEAGQAGRIQVDMPSLGRSQAWTKTHTPMISNKIKISFISCILSSHIYVT